MLQYTREFLLSRQSVSRALRQWSVDRTMPRELRPRKRDRRGSVRVTARRRRYGLLLPSVVFGNVESIRNKVTELAACVQHLHEYREANLICLAETWLTENDGDPDIPNFDFFRLDRSVEATDKTRGGGVCVAVNRRWCTNVTVKDTLCCEDVELISVALRPFYLPREFNQLFVTVVYIHPKANVHTASEKVSAVVNRLCSASPDSPCFVIGDFNKCRLKFSLPHFKQYVTCPTLNDSTIDLCYGNIPCAYRSRQLPKLGRSKHSMVQLVPLYRQRLKRIKPVVKEVKMWTSEATETLNGCFEATDWDVLTGDCHIDTATEVTSDYINFCADMIVDTKQVKIYGNNKPWVHKHLKSLLKSKRVAWAQGKKAEVRRVQQEIDAQIKADKRRFKAKLEEDFRSNNPRQCWKGIQTITGHKAKKEKPQNIDETKLAEDLNVFYGRFDNHNFSEQQNQAMREVLRHPSRAVEITQDEVKTTFRKIKSRSAPGPDNVAGRVVKDCRDSLAPVFTQLFRVSLREGIIPRLWKSSTVVPVPKKQSPKELNDYRPVALTSIPFKCLERIVLRQLRQETAQEQDSMQFAYCKNKSAEDAITTLLHHLHEHLDQPRTYARLLFVDFSSAFNTIQPHLMVNKLLAMSVNPLLIRWIFSFLTERPQHVRVGNALSSTRTTNTGAPQGCVLSPVLFTLYTADCRSTEESTVLIKFADDTSLTGLIRHDETQYLAAVRRLVDWCDANFLELNVSKTKEMVIDFGKTKRDIQPLIIQDQPVDIVDTYKYLGTVIDNKLSWSANVDACCRKANQRMYFLRKLKSFQISGKILFLYYQAAVQSIMLYNQVCYFGSAKKTDTERMRKVTKAAQRLLKVDLTTPTAIYQAAVNRKLKRILSDSSHPLHSAAQKCVPARESSRRLLCPRVRTTRMFNSFLPSAIRLYNSTL